MSPEPGRKRARLSGAIGALLVLALLPVLTVAAVDSPATALELHRCDLDGVRARCGTLPVYEDRAAGSGRMIELRIAVVPARSGRSAPDPVFFLAGGPGGAWLPDHQPVRGVVRRHRRTGVPAAVPGTHADGYADRRHVQLNGAVPAARLPRWLHAASQGDWREVVDLVDWLWDILLDEPRWQVLNLTTICHEPWAQLRRAETEALAGSSYLTHPDLRVLTVPEEICAMMPRPDAAALYHPPAVVKAPVLAVNGEADPNDPPEFASGLTRYYPDSRLLVATDQAHQFGPDRGCLRSLVDQFITRASAVAVAPECLGSVTAPRFSIR